MQCMKKRYKVQHVQWKDGARTLIRDTLTNKILSRSKEVLNDQQALRRFRQRGTLDTKKTLVRFKNGTQVITTLSKPRTTHQLQVSFQAVVQLEQQSATIKPKKGRYYIGFSRLVGTHKEKLKQAVKSAKGQLLEDYPQIDYSDPIHFKQVKVQYVRYKKVSDA